MQPYFFPYIGYFQLIRAVDKYVIYDDVNFIKGGWINRNYILHNNQKHLFSMKLDHSSPNKRINEIFIKDDFKKLSKLFYYSYLKAPYFTDVYPLIEDIFSFNENNLAIYLTNSLLTVSKYLDIDTEFLMSSSLNKDDSLKNQDKVIHICELLGATTYINAIGGQTIYNNSLFSDHNIEIKYLKSSPKTYKQFDNEFVPWLSIIDVMMFNSKNDICEMLIQNELV